MARNAAQRRYTRSVLLLSLGYVLILLGVVSYFDNSAPTGPLAVIAAVLPALPIVGIVFVIGRYLVDETDEYLRMKFNRQILIATGLMLTIATIWGFLENFGLAPHVEAYWAAVVWFFGLGIGGFVNRLTFGEGGC